MRNPVSGGPFARIIYDEIINFCQIYDEIVEFCQMYDEIIDFCEIYDEIVDCLPDL